jgi:type IV secretion system protein VirD4
MISKRRVLEVSTAFAVAAVVSFGIGTQYIAWRLGYQSALGHPVAFVGTLPVYPPWRIIEWLPWRHLIPDIAVGLAIAAGCAAMPLWAWVASVVLSPRQPEFGKTAWGSRSEARRAGILARRPAGTVLGQWPDDQLISYAGDEHQLVAGAAGSGKTTGPVISSLLAWPWSALVYDPKRELYAQTAEHRSRFSGTFYFDPACPHSARFNPLWEIRAGTVHEVGDVQNVVSILIDPSGTKNSHDYWDSDAAKMLTGLIVYALRELPREQQHLATINDMLLDIKNTLEAMAGCSHERVEAIAEYLLGLPDKQFGGVHGSASTALILYDDPIVARNIRCSDFRISDLVCSDQPITCYLQVRPTDAVRLRPLTRLILTQVAQALMYDTDAATDGRSKKHRLLYLLEEFPSLGRLDFFSTQMRVMRGYGITALLIVQSFKDIISTYGRDQTIVDNCRIVVCFAAADPDTQKMISTMLGSATEAKVSVTRPRGGLTWFKGSRSVSEQRRPLLDAGEVRQLGYDEQLVLVTGEKPFRTKKVQWFRHRLLRKFGTNLRQGGKAPGQNPQILAMAQEHVPAEPRINQRLRERTAAPSDSRQSVLAQVVALAEWSNNKAAKTLFPDNAEMARKWISGTRDLPTVHAPYVTWLASILEECEATQTSSGHV